MPYLHCEPGKIGRLEAAPYTTEGRPEKACQGAFQGP
ncbi:hypothetical protein PMIN01_12160 [Paraphaeosphaeria minitans]|uniref:Uncharacterized protein n=1 Tax=Paraphaeosphaeria minitans TaxID=565426 RepID=A0A9P6G7D0_9PLEO|nr:hypothetical protein PMIN01_12160 [Paraphaeosphaeria minitans]